MHSVDAQATATTSDDVYATLQRALPRGLTTSPDIAANRWVELADPKHMYPAQRIVPLVRAGALDFAS